MQIKGINHACRKFDLYFKTVVEVCGKKLGGNFEAGLKKTNGLKIACKILFTLPTCLQPGGKEYASKLQTLSRQYKGHLGFKILMSSFVYLFQGNLNIFKF